MKNYVILICMTILLLSSISAIEYIENNHGTTINILADGTASSPEGVQAVVKWSNITDFVIQKASDVTATTCSIWFNNQTTTVGTNGTFSGDNCTISLGSPLPLGVYWFTGATPGGNYASYRSGSGFTSADKQTIKFINSTHASWTNYVLTEVHGIVGVWTNDIDIFSPNVSLNSPINNTNSTNSTIFFNATIRPKTYSLTNSTFYIWYSNGTLFNTSTNTTFNGNISTFSINNFTVNTYLWNVLGVQGNANGTNSSFATNNYTLNIVNQVLALCNATYTNPFLNITFKDENSLANINASIPTSTFTYWTASLSSTTNQTLTFSDNTDNNYYTFCSNVNDTINVLSELQYRRVSDYPQRIWQPSTQQYNNTLTTQVLYLLSTTDGIFVTYQVLDTSESPIEDVNVVSTRVVSGDTIQVGAGTTDSAGTVTFWMNPDFEHTTTFTKTGFDDFVFTHFPTQASYTITLGGEITTEDDFSQGITQTIRPSSDFLYRNQLYNFNYTINSTYWNLTSFQFTLTYANGTQIGSNTSSTSIGGLISFNNVNVSNSSTISMNYLYNIDNNDSTQRTGVRVWITQTSEGTEFSIWQLIQDSNTYISAGFFGFDNFGKTLLSFVIIVLMVGGLSQRYGIASEGAIMGILFGIVFFLDVGLSFIPPLVIGDIVAIEHFYTYITFLILLGVLIKEEKY